MRETCGWHGVIKTDLRISIKNCWKDSLWIGASQFIAGSGCRAATTPSAFSGRNRVGGPVRCTAGRRVTLRSATSSTFL